MKGDQPPAWRLLLRLFASFARVGAFTIGGGYAMIPIIQREVVDRRGWATEEEFVDIIGLSQTAPGAIAINSSIFVGFRTAGLLGAVSATLGMVLPPFAVILVIAVFFQQFLKYPLVMAAFAGVRPAVLGLILAAVLKIGKTVLKKWSSVALTAALLAAGLVLNLHPVLSIAIAAAIGAWLFFEKGEVSR